MKMEGTVSSESRPVYFSSKYYTVEVRVMKLILHRSCLPLATAVATSGRVTRGHRACLGPPERLPQNHETPR